MIISIQYLRGLAALAVVIFHLFPVFVRASPNPTSGGAAGVDVFFVISGFIMWHISQQNNSRPFTFLSHRIARIVPPYWIVTVMLAVCATAKPNLFPLDNPGAYHVLLSLAFIPHGSLPHGAPLVSQGWTLNYEMFFYIIFAFALLIRPKMRFASLAIIMSMLCMVGLIAHPRQPILELFTSNLLIEFVAGMAIALSFERNWIIPVPIAIVSAICAVAAMATQILPDQVRAVHFGAPAALLVYSAVSLERANWVGQSRPFLALGRISYSLYLVHFMAGNVVLLLAPHIGLPTSGLPTYGLSIVIAVVFGFAFYHFVEAPLTSTLSRKLLRKRRASTPIQV